MLRKDGKGKAAAGLEPISRWVRETLSYNEAAPQVRRYMTPKN